MTDIFDHHRRSVMMRKIGSKNTKPELALRRAIHALGFRFRLHCAALPGSPDLVFPKFKTVVFVHGCFWHRHIGCKRTFMPKSNVQFWSKKFDVNVARDHKVQSVLRTSGWKVVVIWECELTSLERTERVARKLQRTLIRRLSKMQTEQ